MTTIGQLLILVTTMFNLDRISATVASRLEAMAEISTIKHERRVIYAKLDTGVRMEEDHVQFQVRLADLEVEKARYLSNPENAKNWEAAGQILDRILAPKP